MILFLYGMWLAYIGSAPTLIHIIGMAAELMAEAYLVLERLPQERR